MTITLIFENYPKSNLDMPGNATRAIPYFLRLNKQYEIGNIEKAKNSCNWVYPIAVRYPMYEKSVFLNSYGENSLFYLNRVNKDILKLVAEDKGWICLDFTEEPISNEVLAHFISYIDKVNKIKLRKSNFDKLLDRTIILTTQMKSSKHPYIQNKRLFSLSCRRENEISFLDYSSLENEFIYFPEIDKFQEAKNTKVFSCFNYDYTAAEIRFLVLAILQKLDLLKFGHISVFQQGKDFNSHYHDYCTLNNKRKLNVSFDQCHKVNKLLDLKNTLDKSFINLVVEAYYSSTDFDTLYITEKTFRNFYLKKPFLLIGQYDSLAALKNIGYKTFHPYIKEDYDNEKNDSVRLQMIFKELKRLCYFTEEDWKEFYKNISPVLEHNFKVNTEVRPKTSYETFKEYING